MHNYKLKLVDSSRIIADMLVKDIGHDADKFGEMFEIAMLDEYPLSMRATRIVALCAEIDVNLVQPYIDRIINSLGKLKVDGVKRSFLKILAELPVNINEDSSGLLTDLAFTYLEDPKQAIAIRYYCIDILLKVARNYPEIGNELGILLVELVDDSPAGLKSKSKKVLKYLKQANLYIKLYTDKSRS